MARHIQFILIAWAFVFPKLQAQDISKLTIPTSPAFSILDFEPSAIMRPTSARGLAADVLNAFDKNGKLLLNLDSK